MKKDIQIGLAVIAIFSICGNCGIIMAAENEEEIMLADPTIFPYEGKYYMAGTQGGNPAGFTVYESDNLINWYSTDSLPNLSVGKSIFGTSGFWAPQFIQLDGKTGMLYTANEQVAIAHADSINGVYTGTELPIDASEKNIDPFLFRDDDGKYYLYHVRFNKGNYIWVGEYDIKNNAIIPGTLKQALYNDQAWEDTGVFESVPIMEGPTVIKLKDTYYLFYSANHFMSPDYAVGYATAKSPSGPWIKNPANPIIHRNIVGENGAGHGDVFIDSDRKYRYVYHVHNSDSIVSPRRTRILSLNLVPSDNDTIPFEITVDTGKIIKPVKKTGVEIFVRQGD